MYLAKTPDEVLKLDAIINSEHCVVCFKKSEQRKVLVMRLENDKEAILQGISNIGLPICSLCGVLKLPEKEDLKDRAYLLLEKYPFEII